MVETLFNPCKSADAIVEVDDHFARQKVVSFGGACVISASLLLAANFVALGDFGQRK